MCWSLGVCLKAEYIGLMATVRANPTHDEQPMLRSTQVRAFDDRAFHDIYVDSPDMSEHNPANGEVLQYCFLHGLVILLAIARVRLTVLLDSNIYSPIQPHHPIIHRSRIRCFAQAK